MGLSAAGSSRLSSASSGSFSSSGDTFHSLDGSSSSSFSHRASPSQQDFSDDDALLASNFDLLPEEEVLSFFASSRQWWTKAQADFTLFMQSPPPLGNNSYASDIQNAKTRLMFAQKAYATMQKYCQLRGFIAAPAHRPVSGLLLPTPSASSQVSFMPHSQAAASSFSLDASSSSAPTAPLLLPSPSFPASFAPSVAPLFATSPLFSVPSQHASPLSLPSAPNSAHTFSDASIASLKASELFQRTVTAHTNTYRKNSFTFNKKTRPDNKSVRLSLQEFLLALDADMSANEVPAICRPTILYNLMEDNREAEKKILQQLCRDKVPWTEVLERLNTQFTACVSLVTKARQELLLLRYPRYQGDDVSQYIAHYSQTASTAKIQIDDSQCELFLESLKSAHGGAYFAFIQTHLVDALHNCSLTWGTLQEYLKKAESSHARAGCHCKHTFGTSSSSPAYADDEKKSNDGKNGKKKTFNAKPSYSSTAATPHASSSSSSSPSSSSAVTSPSATPALRRNGLPKEAFYKLHTKAEKEQHKNAFPTVTCDKCKKTGHCASNCPQ
jgi:hypothetical protein